MRKIIELIINDPLKYHPESFSMRQEESLKINGFQEIFQPCDCLQYALHNIGAQIHSEQSLMPRRVDRVGQVWAALRISYLVI